MKKTLFCIMATGKICSGAWLAVVLGGFTAAAQTTIFDEDFDGGYTGAFSTGSYSGGSPTGCTNFVLASGGNPNGCWQETMTPTTGSDYYGGQVQLLTVSGNTDTNPADYVLSFDAKGSQAANIQFMIQTWPSNYFGGTGPVINAATNEQLTAANTWQHFSVNLGSITTNSPTGVTWQFNFQLNSWQWGGAGNTDTLTIDNITLTTLPPQTYAAAYTWTTFAGYPSSGSADGVGSVAQFVSPANVALDSNGNVYVTDVGDSTIRKITPAGVVITIAGFPGASGSADGTNGTARFNTPSGIAVDNAGNVYVTDTYNQTIRKITPVGTNWVVSTVAGSARNHGSADGTNGAARFYAPSGIAVDSGGNLYVADSGNSTIRKITPVGTNWVVSTIAGLAGIQGSTDGTGHTARFSYPGGVAADGAGNLYVADSGNYTIRKITSAAVVRTIAGSVSGSADGTGSAARFSLPGGVAADSAGNLYVADTANNTIRQITSAGVVNTLAGLAGSSGTNDGAGSDARFNGPSGVAVDGAGNLYVADTVNNTIRQITSAGVVNTLAGLAGSSGANDGYGNNARFSGPSGVAVDGVGNLYVADTYNLKIRKITPEGPAGWEVTTIASGYKAHGLAVDSSTNLYVADYGDSTIRKITLVNTPEGSGWLVSTIAGLVGIQGSTDGTGTNALFASPTSIAVDGSGNLYVTDAATNGTIRKITPVGTNWVVNTIGGLPGVFGSADGAGNAARFNRPEGITVDSAGIVYVADTGNNTIRKGVFTAYLAANAVSYSQPAMSSSLTVTLLPPEANGQWRFPWEVAWRTNGQTASNLVAGGYPIEFRAIPGWIVIPLTKPVELDNNQSASITNQYYPTIGTVDTNNGGTLKVDLGPNPPSGSYWGFLGSSPPWYPSDYSTNLAAGTYLIGFATVSNRVTPPNLSVQVQAGLTTYVSENYLLAQPAPAGALLPTPVPPANISDLTDYPFGFNGQLETDVGYGSGVAVQAYVVLTAGHLVFNDQTLSYASQAYWYFQEEANVFEPDPLQARGCYVLSGYAAQRTNDLKVYAPDTSTPQSRNLDVAALYFLLPVAGPGGGYGGYLPSDATPNPWLTGTSLKMLVGYPVDGSQFEKTTIVPGEMYQTDPQPYPLTLATDPVADQQVYTATWFLSYPGNSGGPLYVQYNGYYYPAGVYLGSLYNGTTPYASAVRAIDSDVVNLITNAAASGYTGGNYAGGGVITFIPSQAVNSNSPGCLQFWLAPPAAVAAGAAWRLQGDTNDNDYGSATNFTWPVRSTNAFGVQFKPVAGWNLPTDQTVTVQPGQITAYTAFYTVTNPVLVAGKSVGLGITGTTGTVYQLQRRTSLSSGSWLPVSTNTILTTGFNLLLPQPATNGNAFFYRAVWLGY
ncbi:MAG TPA: NHL repeat-containing protein [Verrucomicrobiae bacterium]|nr:NHL repeat-containing protein [Verrucomicrobiae bacterium]